MKNLKVLIVFTSVVAILVSINGRAFAWTNDENDPNEQQTISKTDTANIPAEGIFSAFDPTNPPGPNPPAGDKAWVDVTLPTKVIFGQNDTTEGIVSPVFKIKNNSVKGVKVEVSKFEMGKNSDHASLKNLRLNLQVIPASKNIKLIDGKTVVEDAFELATLGSAGGNDESVSFSFNGSINDSFDFSSLGKEVVKPNYTLELKFTAEP